MARANRQNLQRVLTQADITAEGFVSKYGENAGASLIRLFNERTMEIGGPYPIVPDVIRALDEVSNACLHENYLRSNIRGPVTEISGKLEMRVQTLVTSILDVAELLGRGEERNNNMDLINAIGRLAREIKNKDDPYHGTNPFAVVEFFEKVVDVLKNLPENEWDRAITRVNILCEIAPISQSLDSLNRHVAIFEEGVKVTPRED